MGVRHGSGFGRGGIEIDHTAPESPRHEVLAEIPNLFGPGFTGQMTYYETPAGNKVFAAGAFTLAGSISSPDVRPLVANVWRAHRPGRATYRPRHAVPDAGYLSGA